MWFKHPRYKLAKRCFISEVGATQLTNLSHHLPKILFICGGDPKILKNREIIESYMRKHQPEFLFFRAEFAWNIITKTAKRSSKETNALLLEEWLAAFSDAVVILVESFGTVAELGAFSISLPLRQKLLPLLDKKYKSDESFINTGPVAWVNQDSWYSPCIYSDFGTILTSMPQLIKQLKDGSGKYSSRKSDDTTIGEFKFTKKELLFYIIYIITALGPINEKEIINIVNKTISFGTHKKDQEDISFVISLSVALELVNYYEFEDEIYYSCLNYKELYRDETTLRLLTMSQHMRARCLSDLIHIPLYKKMLRDVR